MRKIRESKYQKLFSKGQKFKKWTIIGDKIELNTHKEAFILSRCDCGFEKLISCYYLKKGSSTGCFNCGHGNKGESNPSWKGFKDIPGSFLARVKSRAKKIIVEFDITGEDIYNQWLKQNKKCALTGLDIDFVNINKGNTTRKESKYDLICSASLDRIDSSKGYTKNNIQIVHKDINIMKNEYNQEYFISFCKKVFEFKC